MNMHLFAHDANLIYTNSQKQRAVTSFWWLIFEVLPLTFYIFYRTFYIIIHKNSSNMDPSIYIIPFWLFKQALYMDMHLHMMPTQYYTNLRNSELLQAPDDWYLKCSH